MQTDAGSLLAKQTAKQTLFRPFCLQSENWATILQPRVQSYFVQHMAEMHFDAYFPLDFRGK